MRNMGYTHDEGIVMGWGTNWDPGEWEEELAFHKWCLEYLQADMVLLELVTIGLEARA